MTPTPTARKVALSLWWVARMENTRRGWRAAAEALRGAAYYAAICEVPGSDFDYLYDLANEADEIAAECR